MEPEHSLDNGRDEPLYRQLEELLRRDIENGVYKKGDRFPTETQLGERYHVSRITVRGALEGLQRDRYLVRRQGLGTFVARERAPGPGAAPLEGLWEQCLRRGGTPGSRVLRCTIDEATADDRRDLALAPESRVVVLERIRLCDGVPFADEMFRFPGSYEFLLDEDLAGVSLHALLREKYGISFAAPPRTLSLVPASYEAARYLGLPRDRLLLSVECVARENGGKPGYRSLQLVAADRFALQL